MSNLDDFVVSVLILCILMALHYIIMITDTGYFSSIIIHLVVYMVITDCVYLAVRSIRKR